MRQSKAVALAAGGIALWAMSSSSPVNAAPSGKKLTLNGKVASTKMQTIGGQTFVPLADVAKALGMVVVKKGDGYELKKAGGANPVGNMSGKVGDVLFDGKWRFEVLETKLVDEYTIKAPKVEPVSTAWDLLKWDSTTRVLRAAPNYQLVLFRCRVTNGQKTKQSLWTAPLDEGVHTALTDTSGGSHIPAAYDYPGATIETKAMLPGEILTFSLLFSVPQGTQQKDLIFSLKNNNWQAKPTDVRVSLQSELDAGTRATNGGATERIER